MKTPTEIDQELQAKFDRHLREAIKHTERANEIACEIQGTRRNRSRAQKALRVARNARSYEALTAERKNAA